MQRTLKTWGLAVSLLAGAAGSDEPTPVERLTRAARYWQSRDRDDLALQAWRQVLKLDGRSPEALAAVGADHARAGRLEAAREVLARLAGAHPDHPATSTLAQHIEIATRSDLLERARRYAREQRLDEAVAAYEELFRGREPPEPLGLEYYETLSGTERGWQKAVDALRRLAAASPRALRYRLALGRALTYREHTRLEGISLLAAMYEGAPELRDSVRASWRRALTWLPATKEHEPRLREYLARHPGDDVLKQRHAEILAAARRAKATREGYRALERNDLAGAERAFTSLGRERDPDALVGLAIVALRREDPAKALGLLEQARALAPTRRELWEQPLRTAKFWSLMAQALAAARDGRPSEAERKLIEAQGVSEADGVHAVVALGELHRSLGRHQAAEALFRKVVQANPDRLEAKRSLVEVLVATDRVDEAVSLDADLAERDPAQARGRAWIVAEGLRLRAARKVSEGRFDDALADLEASRQASPRHRWTLHDLAALHLRLGEPTRALEVADALTAVAPDLPEALLVTARAHDAAGHPGMALEALSAITAEKLTPEIAALKRRLELQVRLHRAVALARKGKAWAARKQVAALEEQAGSDPEQASHVALAWASLGAADRAAALSSRLLQARPPPSPGVQLRLGGALLRAGNDAAVEALIADLDGTRLDPAEERGLAELRIAWTVRQADVRRGEGDLGGAARLLEPLLEEHPHHPRLLSALGRVLQDAGRFADAAELFESVLERDPMDEEALSGLVHAAVASGQLDRARLKVRSALGRAPQRGRLHLLEATLALEAGDDRAADVALTRAKSLAREDGASGRALSALARRGDLLDRGADEPGEPSLEAEVERELDRLDARRRPRVSGGMGARQRSGEPGLGALTEVRLPVDYSEPVGAGRVTVSVTPVAIDSGALSAEDRFGSGAPLPKRGLNEPSRGVELMARYTQRELQLEVGTSPLGLRTVSWLGALSWTHRWNSLRLTARLASEAVKDSRLSYAGARDPASGEVWGGVVRRGGALGVAYDIAPATLRLSAGHDWLSGTQVAGNRAVHLGMGVDWRLRPGEAIRPAAAGLNVYALGYQWNLGHFTLGHGGYFSPQEMLHAGFALRWEMGGRPLRAEATIEPGVDWYREDTAPYFPLDPSRQSARESATSAGGTPLEAFHVGRSRLGPTVSARGSASYAITRGLEAVLRVDWTHAPAFDEVTSTLLVRLDVGADRAQ